MQFVQNYKYIDLIRVKDWQFFSLLDALASFKDWCKKGCTVYDVRYMTCIHYTKLTYAN